jgi:cell division transport system permease protein
VRPGFFIKEAMRSLRRNVVPSFAALASILVTTLVIGVFIPVVQATNGAANAVSHRINIDAFMNTNATAADEARVRNEILHAPHVKSVQFVSKAQALAQQSKLNPEAYQALGYNPLPDTFRVTPDTPGDSHLVLAELTQGGSAAVAGHVTDSSIQTVNNSQGETNKILTVTRLVKITMAVLAILLVVASVLLIANTIRLSLFSRRREVEVMKLVGATDSFIRWPFVLEGLFLGAIGGGAAIFVLVVAKLTVINSLNDTFSLVAHSATISFIPLIAILMTCAMGVSTIGSGLSLRRFLRV